MSYAVLETLVCMVHADVIAARKTFLERGVPDLSFDVLKAHFKNWPNMSWHLALQENIEAAICIIALHSTDEMVRETYFSLNPGARDAYHYEMKSRQRWSTV